MEKIGGAIHGIHKGGAGGGPPSSPTPPVDAAPMLSGGADGQQTPCHARCRSAMRCDALAPASVKHPTPRGYTARVKNWQRVGAVADARIATGNQARAHDSS